VDPSSVVHPVRIAPGATEQLTVTITPSAAVSANVSGVINLVTLPALSSGSQSLPTVTTGEVIARVPYAYHVTP
jgi:hypothetical protein